MSKKVLSVGYDFPGNIIEYISPNSRKSLSDADIIIFRPDISGYYSYGRLYRGKPWLGESSSFQLVESINHWFRELKESLHAGKTIIVLLVKLEEIYVDTGERNYSGTGKNSQETILVSLRNNYESLPVPLGILNSQGSDIKLAEGSEVISSYWSYFSNYSQYKVHLVGGEFKKLLLSRDGRKTIGAEIRFKETEGTMILLPDLSTFGVEFFTNSGKWTKAATTCGHKLLSHILEIDKTLQASRLSTPAPVWTQDPIFTLPIEEKLLTSLSSLEKKITNLEAKKEKIKEELSIGSRLKHLLYEKGPLLEEQIVFTLKLMGFTASPFKNSESEFDVVFESPEGRFLGEVEGKDNKAINVDKLRQLEMNILEDFDREDVKEMAKGVLFGNAYRLSQLKERKEWFTAKCKSASIRTGTALVRTADLFFIARYLSVKNDTGFASTCRKAIFSTQGDIVQFPDIPLDDATKEISEKNDS